MVKEKVTITHSYGSVWTFIANADYRDCSVTEGSNISFDDADEMLIAEIRKRKQAGSIPKDKIVRI